MKGYWSHASHAVLAYYICVLVSGLCIRDRSLVMWRGSAKIQGGVYDFLPEIRAGYTIFSPEIRGGYRFFSPAFRGGIQNYPRHGAKRVCSEMHNSLDS